MTTKNISKLVAGAAIALSSLTAHATIVEFETSLGNFKVNLHDENTPITVQNFLSYVNDGSYDNTIIHRTVENFVVQGGGAKFEGTLPPTWIETKGEITNEPVYSNVTATISMAKRGGQINSATSQWFINLKDNSTALDPVDSIGGGAYAVFGEVIEDGMSVVNAIADVPRCDTGHGGFAEVPMPNYTTEQCADSSHVPGQENFVTIYSVTIVNSASNTADSLSPVANTLYVEPTTPPPSGGDNSSSGGSMAWLSLSALLLLVRRKK